MATENYTTYSIFPVPLVYTTVTASKLDINQLPRSFEERVYDDKGAGHFGAAFSHLVKTTDQDNIVTQAKIGFWAVANTLADIDAWETGSAEALSVYLISNGSSYWTYRLSEHESAALDSYAGSNGEVIYWTITRSGAGGVLLSAYVYSDAARTVLEDTITVAPPSGRTYRYNYGMNSHGSTTVAYVGDMDVELLDLQEAAAYVPYPFSRGLRGGHQALSGGLA